MGRNGRSSIRDPQAKREGIKTLFFYNLEAIYNKLTYIKTYIFNLCKILSLSEKNDLPPSLITIREKGESSLKRFKIALKRKSIK